MNELCTYIKQKTAKGQKIAIMGIGSVLRSDDGAGMYCIGILQSKLENYDNLLLIQASTAPENFTGVIKSFEPNRLFIVDAAHMGLSPGKIRIINMADITGVSFSTHMLPLPVMLKYLELETACEIICIGIEPKSTEQGFEICDEVRKGAETLAEIFAESLINHRI